ncbi:hypothetical protein C0991_011542, partial [Blastosporella zonata]
LSIVVHINARNLATHHTHLNSALSPRLSSPHAPAVPTPYPAPPPPPSQPRPPPLSLPVPPALPASPHVLLHAASPSPAATTPASPAATPAPVPPVASSSPAHAAAATPPAAYRAHPSAARPRSSATSHARRSAYGLRCSPVRSSLSWRSVRTVQGALRKAPKALPSSRQPPMHTPVPRSRKLSGRRILRGPRHTQLLVWPPSPAALKCNNDCALALRGARLAEALGIMVEAREKTKMVTYHPDLLAVARANGIFLAKVEKALDEFVTSQKKTQVLPHMPPDRREFVRGLAAVYRMDTQIIDQEPNRSVRLLRRLDTRVPNPLLSATITASTPTPPSLGKLTDLRTASTLAWRAGPAISAPEPTKCVGMEIPYGVCHPEFDGQSSAIEQADCKRGSGKSLEFDASAAGAEGRCPCNPDCCAR